MGSIVEFEHHIPQLNRDRMIRIYLPEGYNTTNQRYPVIYMHDAQNLYTLETAAYGMIWGIKDHMEKLESEGHPGFIVVGVDNAGGLERLDEYSPWVNTELKHTMERFVGSRDVGGEGDAYACYIKETLKPMVDANYRTLSDRDNTAIIGSSMGGVISLYIGLKYTEIFGRIGAFSTAAWFCEPQLIDYMKHVDPTQKVYLDIGTKETSDPTVSDFADRYVNGTNALGDALLEAGLPQENLKVVIEEGAEHNELSWQRRFPEAFSWMWDI